MYYKREKYLKQLIAHKDTDFIKIISGVRRCGKSVLLKQYRDHLLSSGIEDRQILYLNLEAYESTPLHEEKAFYQYIVEKLENPNLQYYLLVDEIQFLEGWQRVINGLRVSHPVDIVITGSNAKLLSGELATLLSGRYVEILIYPFSFQEFIDYKGIEKTDRALDSAYLEYEKYGGFPAVIMAHEEIRKSILAGIYDSILLNDIAARGGVKDSFSLKRLVNFLADNVGQLINANRITNLLKNEKLAISNHTVNRYLELLQDAFLFYEVKPYDIRGKAYLKQNAKYFMVDNGLRNQICGYKNSNFGNRLENIVLMELLQNKYSVDVVRIEEKEIDFLARKDGVTKYYQVAHQLSENTHETDNFLLVKDHYEKILITARYPETDNFQGISVRYIVDWLLEEK